MSSNTRADVVVVFLTCPSTKVARRIAQTLIAQRLAACVNILPGVDSVFWWEGKVDRARETLLIIKTTRARFRELQPAVRRSHPYDVPEILALPVAVGSPAYLDWVVASVANQ
ncbi:MAG: divalent-cation tolerance protein CutA [Candidatus Omnitrophica bacterium]|nr:divalent-cation tolerance protein CutA [Candidatus Omnitrophota bacterium]